VLKIRYLGRFCRDLEDNDILSNQPISRFHILPLGNVPEIMRPWTAPYKIGQFSYFISYFNNLRHIKVGNTRWTYK